MKKDFLLKQKDNKDDKVLNFDNSAVRYMALTEKHAEDEDLSVALSFALSGYRVSPSLEAIEDIADLYADMGLYELSNKFWYKFLSIAPTDKVSVAYEELAINYFYLNNFALAGYYFNLKYKEDGFISREGLDEDIIEFFEGMSPKKNMYRIVYPEGKSDYSELVKSAKKAMVIGDFNTAVKYLSSVPTEEKEYRSAMSDLAMAYFLSGKEDEAVSVNRKIIEEFGPDASAYCNLSEIYRLKGDADKSGYYYDKAKELGATEQETVLKLATCALEHADYKSSAEYFSRGIDDKILDTDVLCLYGIALLNADRFSDAYEVFKKAYMVDPDNTVCKYYTALSRDLDSGKQDKKILPIKYDGNIPEEEVLKRAKLIKQVLKGGRNKILSCLKDEEFRDVLRWGIAKGSSGIAEGCIHVLSFANTKETTDMLSSFLLDVDVSDRVKEGILFILVIDGVKSRISININGLFVKVRAGKPLCEKFPNGELFFASYALAFARMVAVGTDGLNKMLRATDRIFVKVKDCEEIQNFSREEIATFIVLKSGLPFLKNRTDVCKVFGTEEKRIDQLIKIYGE